MSRVEAAKMMRRLGHTMLILLGLGLGECGGSQESAAPTPKNGDADVDAQADVEALDGSLDVDVCGGDGCTPE